MNYVQLKPPTQPTRETTSTFSKGGINLRDLPQLLDPKFALNITNYIITADGGLKKREGLTELFEVAGIDPIEMLIQYTNDVILFGYATTLAAYRLSTDTITNIKTNFVEVGMEGVRYGDYAFIASPGDKVGRVSQTITYAAQTANYTVGTIVTGGTSGATAVILQDNDLGVTGTLTLGNIDGTFVSGELLTGSPTGSATSSSVVTLVFTSITNAPIAGTIKVAGNRLYAGRTQDDQTEVRYSEVDTGTNPPFATWSIGTLATDGGRVNFRNAGPVQAIESLGNAGIGEVIVVFADNGKWAFAINTIDSGGTLKKVDTTVIDRQDFGGFRGAIQTPKGLFYVNERGLWQLVSLGQPNIKFSDQEYLTSVLLGINYFDDVDLTNCDLVYDQQRQSVYIAAAKNSAQNNYVIAYNVEQKAFSEFRGWSISRFLNYQNNFYAGSSVKTTVYNMFDGFADDGVDIWTDFYTEIKSGNLNTRQQLMRTWIMGILSLSTELELCFDIYDKEGNFIQNKLCLDWTANDSSALDGWSVIGWGTGPFGGSVTDASLVESFAGRNTFIRNFQRLRIHLTGNDQLPHELRWVSCEMTKLIPIRRRTGLTLVS